MNIKSYLQTRYKKSTAASYYLDWLHFEGYLSQLNMPIKSVDYRLFLEYVNVLKKRNLKAKSINQKIRVLEKVYSYLVGAKLNPVKGFRVKEGTRTALREPIKIEELELLLSSYPTKTAKEKRNKLVLSLLHYQALQGGEIKALKVEDVNLSKAEIKIPSTKRNQSRILSLTALQLLDFKEYLEKIRPELVCYPNAQLFISGGLDPHFQNSMSRLRNEIKALCPQLKQLKDWRASVIVHWLSIYPLLSVQQRLGHRYPSSTERYKIHTIKDLQEGLLLHHPLQVNWESETLK
jgi:integrase/recombinase XerD